MKPSYRTERARRYGTPARPAYSMLIIISLACGAGAFTAWGRDAVSNPERQSADAQEAAPSQLTVTVSDQGVTPTSATVSAGIVHLIVKNQSGQEHLTLRLSRENGELIREVAVQEKTAEWVTELELSAPGKYVLTVVGATSWSCQITAQGRPAGEGG